MRQLKFRDKQKNPAAQNKSPVAQKNRIREESALPKWPFQALYSRNTQTKAKRWGDCFRCQTERMEAFLKTTKVP